MKNTLRQLKLKWPTKVSVKGRRSTITNSFVQSIIPRIEATDDELIAALETLGYSINDVECIYCGDPATQFDHLNPLVRDKLPTGFITDFANLVPCCNGCNSSKGAKEWRDWILGAAPKSPTTRKIKDVRDRIKRIERFELKFKPTKIDFEELVGKDLWSAYLNENKQVEKALNGAQVRVDLVRDKVRSRLGIE